MNKRLITSLVFNSLIVILVLMCTIFIFANFNFMGIEGDLTPENTNAFSYFTVDSNIILGIFSGILVVAEIMVLTNKRKEIPLFVHVLKFVGTTATTLTLLTVLIAFGPQTGSEFWRLFVNNNLFFHLIVPLLAIISLVFFEYDAALTFKHTFFGAIPAFIYSIYYSINVLSHMDADGNVPRRYDPYGFAQGGIGEIIMTYIIMLIAAYLAGVGLYFLMMLITKLMQKRVNKEKQDTVSEQ